MFNNEHQDLTLLNTQIVFFNMEHSQITSCWNGGGWGYGGGRVPGVDNKCDDIQ